MMLLHVILSLQLLAAHMHQHVLGFVLELQRYEFRGKKEGKKERIRPRSMLLDLMIKEDHRKLKDRAKHRGEWRHWM